MQSFFLPPFHLKLGALLGYSHGRHASDQICSSRRDAIGTLHKLVPKDADEIYRNANVANDEAFVVKLPDKDVGAFGQNDNDQKTQRGIGSGSAEWCLERYVSSIDLLNCSCAAETDVGDEDGNKA